MILEVFCRSVIHWLIMQFAQQRALVHQMSATSGHMLIFHLSPITQELMKFFLSYITCHLSLVTCHPSPVICHQSHVACHLLPVAYHLSNITCNLSSITSNLSPVTCHLSPVTNNHCQQHFLPNLLAPAIGIHS